MYARAVRAYLCVLALLSIACSANECPAVSERSFDACVEACEAGEAEACARLGVAYEGGALGGSFQDLVAARRYFAKACEHAGDQRWLCVLGPSIADVDGDEGRAALEHLCEDGELLACHELARTFLVARSIPLDLPGTAPEEPTAELTIAVLADGSLLLDAQPITLEALRTMSHPPDARAVIAADRRTPHGRVVEVIDALRAAGVTRYAINVAPQADMGGDTRP